MGEPRAARAGFDLREVYLALCLLASRDVFGDDPGWDGHIRWFVDRIRA